MRICSFCNKEIEEGTEKMYVKKDGSIYFFCSSKCGKNMIKLGRDSRKLNGLKKNDSKSFCNDENRRSSKTSYG